MASLAADLFCEDGGHEVFARALVDRFSREIGIRVRLASRSARGGQGRALAELTGWLRASIRPPASLLIVLIDANGAGPNARRSEIERIVADAGYPYVAIGCPDPHVEAWLLASRESFVESTAIPWDGSAPRDGNWKRLLESLVLSSGIPVLDSPMQLALDVVPSLDLYAAGKTSVSLKHFAEELRGALQQACG